MKRFRFFRTLRLGAGLIAAVLALRAEAAASYVATANALATEFLRKSDTSDEALAKFLDEAGASGAIRAAIGEGVKRAKKVRDDGAKPGTKLFALALAESTPGAAVGDAGPSAVNAGATPGGSGTAGAGSAPETAATDEALKKDLQERGRRRLLTFGESTRDHLARANGRLELAEHDDANKKPVPSRLSDQALIDAANADSSRQDASTQAAAKQVAGFLIQVGFDDLRDKSLKAGTAMPERARAVVEQAGGPLERTVPALNLDARLRNAGFSIASGFGVVRPTGGPAGAPDEATMAIAIARWNIFQFDSTARWNRLVGDKNFEGYETVPYFGRLEFNRKSQTGLQRIVPTFFGPFLGRAVAGEKVTLGKAVDQRPYVVGLSTGFGFYDEAAPFLNFDYGYAVTASHGLEGNARYFGVSFDALVLGKILDRFRSGSSTAKPAP